LFKKVSVSSGEINYLPPSTSIQHSQEETPTKILMELSAPPKLSNPGSSRVKRSLHGEVLTTSQNTERKKQKTNSTKNHFKKIVQIPTESSSHQDDDDCCKECEEYYYLTREECDSIKCSVCEKWLHENCTISSKTCIDCGRNKRPKSLGKRTKKREK
jgi:hypothetical protein